MIWRASATSAGIIRSIVAWALQAMATATSSSANSALGVEEQRVWIIIDLSDPVETRPELGDGYRVEAIPRGTLMVLFGEDKPGLIGNVGLVLGEMNINIAAMTFGRKSAGGDAITVLNLDGAIDPCAVDTVARAPHVTSAHLVTFG